MERAGSLGLRFCYSGVGFREQFAFEGESFSLSIFIIAKEGIGIEPFGLFFTGYRGFALRGGWCSGAS